MAGLAPAEQIKEVAERLAKLNPDHRDQPKFKEEGGAIVEVHLVGHVVDLRPLAVLSNLRTLTIWDTGGTLRNLEPLRGLSLKAFTARQLNHLDLSPLPGFLSDLQGRQSYAAEVAIL